MIKTELVAASQVCVPATTGTVVPFWTLHDGIIVADGDEMTLPSSHVTKGLLSDSGGDVRYYVLSDCLQRLCRSVSV